MKGYVCPECHGLGQLHTKHGTMKCKACNARGWLSERQFVKKYDDDFQRIPGFWQRIKRVFQRTH